MKEEFKVFCKNLAFEGKLIGAETTDGLKGNANWNSLRDETKAALKNVFPELNPGDYLWLALGEQDKAVRAKERQRERERKKQERVGKRKEKEEALKMRLKERVSLQNASLSLKFFLFVS